jgi:hypothetical protein
MVYSFLIEAYFFKMALLVASVGATLQFWATIVVLFIYMNHYLFTIMIIARRCPSLNPFTRIGRLDKRQFEILRFKAYLGLSDLRVNNLA